MVQPKKNPYENHKWKNKGNAKNGSGGNAGLKKEKTLIHAKRITINMHTRFKAQHHVVSPVGERNNWSLKKGGARGGSKGATDYPHINVAPENQAGRFQRFSRERGKRRRKGERKVVRFTNWKICYNINSWRVYTKKKITRRRPRDDERS